MRPLQSVARELGVELIVTSHGLPVEAWFQAAHPALVVSCFSTALFTAARYFDTPAATMGVEQVLNRLTPYENSNRIPATITDALIPRLAEDGTTVAPSVREIDQLVRTVAFCMQPQRNFDLFDVAQEYVAEHGTARYFKNRRLSAVGLLAPVGLRNRAKRRLRRRAIGYAVRSRAMGRRMRARALASHARRRAAGRG